MINEGNDKKAEYALLYLKGVYSGLVEIRMRRKLLFILTIECNWFTATETRLPSFRLVLTSNFLVQMESFYISRVIQSYYDGSETIIKNF